MALPAVKSEVILPPAAAAESAAPVVTSKQDEQAAKERLVYLKGWAPILAAVARKPGMGREAAETLSQLVRTARAGMKSLVGHVAPSYADSDYVQGHVFTMMAELTADQWRSSDTDSMDISQTIALATEALTDPKFAQAVNWLTQTRYQQADDQEDGRIRVRLSLLKASSKIAAVVDDLPKGGFAFFRDVDELRHDLLAFVLEQAQSEQLYLNVGGDLRIMLVQRHIGDMTDILVAAYNNEASRLVKQWGAATGQARDAVRAQIRDEAPQTIERIKAQAGKAFAAQIAWVDRVIAQQALRDAGPTAGDAAQLAPQAGSTKA